MARNMVQFQKGMSEVDFVDLYGSESLCHAALAQWRWPDGFECPDCAGRDHCLVKRGERALYQCNACRKQTSVKAGTIFASSKLSLRVWFRAIYLVTQSKQGISSVELGRRLGVTQTTAWTLKHKLAQVMMERNAKRRLKGKVQMDDAYMGGARPGRRGRGAAGKTPFVAAVATTDDGKPDQIILRRVVGFQKIAIEKLAGLALAADASVVSDGLACFAAVATAGRAHAALQTGGAPKPLNAPNSNGSIQCWATSRPRSPGPTARCAPNMCRDTSPSSNTGSIDDTILAR
jgi:transposase-like protein